MQDKAQLIIEQIPKLRRYARALTGDSSAADDLIQDCLELAWSRVHLWRPGSNMRAWMFTIMHNCFANTVRRAKHRPSVVPLEEWGGDAQIGPNQEKAVELRRVLAAIRQLPDEQRAVLLLVGLEEMTYSEAATILGIPLGTVMSRLSRGRERLRNLLTNVSADSAGRASE
ncbi:MAG: sigma-70 family RNA polymerase sigma factor [Proteobacteria bacterium]|nr:sigma-70 family RNA polymerase sigma factor [Pseudomonadota bacterium]